MMYDRVAAGAHRVEEDRERVHPLEGEQIQPQRDHPDQFRGQPDLGNPGEHVRAAEVDSQCQQQQPDGGDQLDDRGVFDTEERRDETAAELGDRGDGDDDRPQVDPADDPCVFAIPQPAGPRIDATRDGVLGHHFTEHEGDQELAAAHDDDPPHRGRTADREAVRKQRIHADKWRQVGEAERHVGPQAHRPVKVLPGVAQRFQVGVVRGCVSSRFNRTGHGEPPWSVAFRS